MERDTETRWHVHLSRPACKSTDPFRSQAEYPDGPEPASMHELAVL